MQCGFLDNVQDLDPVRRSPVNQSDLWRCSHDIHRFRSRQLGRFRSKQLGSVGVFQQAHGIRDLRLDLRRKHIGHSSSPMKDHILRVVQDPTSLSRRGLPKPGDSWGSVMAPCCILPVRGPPVAIRLENPIPAKHLASGSVHDAPQSDGFSSIPAPRCSVSGPGVPHSRVSFFSTDVDANLYVSPSVSQPLSLPIRRIVSARSQSPSCSRGL